MKKRSILSLALHLMIANAQVSNDTIGAIIHADSDFSGGSVSIPIGDYQGLDKSLNDKISSIRVLRGFQVVIYSDANFKGRSQIITESHENLNNFDFNDKISSLKVQEINSKNEPYAYVYYDNDFKGRYNFFGLGEFSAIWPNDRISSIKIRDGYVLTLYEHGDFQGKSHVIKSDISDLQKIGFNDKTSSLKVTMSAATKQKELEEEQKKREELAAAKQKELEEQQKKREELALKSRPVSEVIKTFIDTVLEEEKALSLQKVYPVYLYKIYSSNIYTWHVDNKTRRKGSIKLEADLYSPVNLNKGDKPFEFELENEIVEVSFMGAKFLAINEPSGIPILREITLTEESISDKNKSFITYKSNGKSGFDKEDPYQPPNNIYSLEKIFYATPFPSSNNTHTDFQKALKYRKLNLPMEIFSTSDRLQLSFQGFVFDTRYAELVESELRKALLAKKSEYFLEDLDRLNLLGDDSKLVKTELKKIESLIREKIKIKNIQQIKKNKKCTEAMGYYDFPNLDAKADAAIALLRNEKNPQYDPELLKRQYQTFIETIPAKCTTTETKYNTSIPFANYANFDVLKKIMSRKDLTRDDINRIQQQYYKYKFNKSFTIIKPEWKDVVSFYGGYSELAKNNVNKENYEAGVYNALAVLKSIELLNSNQCLAHVELLGALELNKVSKKTYKYKGMYKIEDYDLLDIYNKNIPEVVFSFENKKYLKNKYTSSLYSVKKQTDPKNENSIDDEVHRMFLSSFDMMINDFVSDEEFLKMID